MLKERYRQSARTAIAIDDFSESFETIEDAFTMLSRARDQLTFESLQGQLSPEKAHEVNNLSQQIDAIEQSLLLIKELLTNNPMLAYRNLGESLKFEVVG
ncbi:hypothetical protein [Egbenema bharatensis]|uniref:hypothetical protein n=1 Tax=Egbenema bharatensis TaxID=3463334 RepID=UPI003A855065